MLMKILEKDVQWKACFKYNGIQLNSSTEIRNSYCNFNTLKCNCNCSKEKHFEMKFMDVFWLFGLIAVIGNLVVIFFVSKKLLFVATVKEKTVYKILVLNLSIADLLFAIYAILVCFFKKNDVICNALGVISLTGYQVDITIIALICYYRLQGVLKPFNVISKKYNLLIILLFVWIFWFMFSLLPIIWPDVFLPNRLSKINLALESIKSIPLNETNNTDVFSILLNTVLKFNSNEVWIQLLKRLGIYPNMTFYNQHQACTISSLSLKSHDKYLTLAILFYNSLLLIFIFIAYTTIFRSVFNCRNLITSSFFQSPDIGRKSKESLKVFKKIFLIVATNFLCWTPVCIVDFWFYFESPNQNECSYYNFLHNHHILVEVIFLLTSVNPILNPYIYCNKFWKKLFKNCKTKIFRINNRLRRLKFFVD